MKSSSSNSLLPFKTAPKKLILVFDATDDVVHGNQDRFFHGYYDHYCFFASDVFCRKQLLVSYLREQDRRRQALAILALLVKRLRQVWPQVRIIFRGDSNRMLLWCERNNVGYIVGSPRTSA